MAGPIEIDEALTEEELAKIPASPPDIQAMLREENMINAAAAPALPEKPLDPDGDAVDQMLEASGAKPTLLGS